MHILHTELISSQMSNSTCEKYIILLIFLSMITLFTMIYLYFFNKSFKVYRILKIVLLTIMIISELILIYCSRIKLINYRYCMKHYEIYNQYYISLNSKIDYTKYKIKSKSNNYIIIEDIKHKKIDN